MINYNFISDDDSEKMQDIIKCLTNICSIPEGSVPLMRGLGIDWSYLSEPTPEIENDYATEIVQKVDEWEPRVMVTNVNFEYGEQGSVRVDIELERGTDWEEEE